MAQDPNIGREILPIPDQPYRGAVPFDARSASAPPQPMLHAPQGAPNIVLVLIDDMGFGIPSAFGVHMPTSERLASGGLRYNHFHTTALCSPTRAAPNLKNTSFTVTADIDSPDGKADGVILAYGGGAAGMSFYLTGGKPKVWYRHFHGLYQVEAPEKLPAGRRALTFSFAYDGGGMGKGGQMSILVDGREVASGRIEQTVPIAFALETVDVGFDWGRPAADDYTSVAFTGGTLNSVLVEVGEAEPVTEAHAAHLHRVAMARQ